MSEIDVLVARISECETVVDNLDGSLVWKVISEDCQKWVDENDRIWQMASDEQLHTMRIQKLAYAHILNIKERYQRDMEAAKKALAEYENQGTSIIRDFDNNVK